MAATYAQLKTPMLQSDVLTSMLSVLTTAGFPSTAWGPTDEPYATIAADSQVLADLSTTIAGIATMGVTDDAEGDALHIHAKDVYDVDFIRAVATIGTVRATDTSGSPHTWQPGDLVFSAKFDATLTFRNSAIVTLGANSTLTFSVYCEQTGVKGNIQATDLQIVTAVPGVAFAAEGAGTTWIATSGNDDELDAALRIRCKAKWATLTTAGPTNAYKSWALAASASINRVIVAEDPTAVYPSPAVTVTVAGPSGVVGSAVVTTLTNYIEPIRPLGILVAYQSAVLMTFPLYGDVRVKAGVQAAATTAVHALLDAWFSGNTIRVNGADLPGLQIGDIIRISVVIEIVMSVAGVLSFTPLKAAAGANYVPGIDDTYIGATSVATLVRGLNYIAVT